MICLNAGEDLSKHRILTKEEAESEGLVDNRPRPYADENRYIHNLRIHKNIYIKQAAKHLGIKCSELSDIEFGRAKSPDDYKEWLESL